ncbi:hypothetical protein AUR64_05240 [Haloprofundus marisrubri]|uniref:Uncharacterized protein n=1 Tax=Haloprofundus marisrubri TaxID=1514971 RepID=A0A0W1RCF3_9EURY|nr:hypothetical protein [Haloprofundus marisrubri]KTG11116.1 hypothetical protein AUR64_05240 [Haloprofundus marisrubri]
MADSVGPAPTENTRRGDPIRCTFRADGTDDTDAEYEGVIQPWAGRTGGLYVAWQVGPVSGRLGTYRAAADELRFGYSGFPERPGQRRYAAKLSESVSDRLSAELASLTEPMLSPHLGAIPTVFDSEVFLAPPNAATTGEVHHYELVGRKGTFRGWIQPWRPPNGGAVYVAWRLDSEDHDTYPFEATGHRFGVFFDGAVWLGSVFDTVSLFRIASGRTGSLDSLGEDVEALYEETTGRRFRATERE